ncbi:DNA-directed RNA polymerase sigma-70 factor [Bacteroidales bacterium]|nr:DNA-directed RNA polymerase sigma-70 factor [Bacteroidales bacterium]
MNKDTNHTIIKGLAAGNSEAYKFLYENHYKALCVFAYQYVDDSFIAETMVSDVFFNIWKTRNEINILQSLRSYLMGAVKNRCLDHLKERKRLEEVKISVGDKLHTSQVNYEDQYDYPLAQLIEKELDLKIKKSLLAMPDLTRRIFELSRFSDLKYQEIAQEIGTSVDTVKYHIKSAIVRLRKDLKEYL